MVRELLFSLLMLVSVSCTSGAVVFAPTPLPPDLSPTQYIHPSEGFSLVLPRNWSVYTQNLTTLASASFSPPGVDEPLVTVSLLNLGRVVDANEMGGLMLQYQTAIRPDGTYYTEQDRQAMGDGSWRLTGVRTPPGGKPQQINTFFARHQSFISVTEAIVATDPSQQTAVQTIINTLQINENAELPSADLSALSATVSAALEILHVATWTTPAGVLYITGEVVNHGTETVASVPVQMVLTNAGGDGIVEAVDTVMGYAIPPGGFAPFSLRFGQGQPNDAIEYRLSLGGQLGEPIQLLDSGSLQWEHTTDYNQHGQLVVTGTVTNENESTAQDTLAIVTIFDEEQQVIAAGFTPLDMPRLKPGETANFVLLVPDLGGVPANSIVTVQALPCEDC